LGTQHPSHFVQRLVLPSFGSKPIGAIEKILLVNGIKQFPHRFLHDLVLEGGNVDLRLFRSKVEKELMEMLDEDDVRAGRFGYIIEEIATVRRNGQSHTIAVIILANFIDLPDFLGCKVKIAESLRKLLGNEINPIPVYGPICDRSKRRHPLHL